MFRNIPHITKNILIINILMFIATLLFRSEISLVEQLGVYTLNSPLFQPYQIITHFFMHSDTLFVHIVFNMFAVVMFGSQLERVWGPKRYFIFYIVSALGAYLLYGGLGTYELYLAKMEILDQFTNGQELIHQLNSSIVNGYYTAGDPEFNYFVDTPIAKEYIRKALTPMVGASGAVFGLLVGFGMLFPNTQLMLIFPPIPIKAKYLVVGYMAIEIYLSFASGSGSSIAHLAHVGGGIAGFIMVKIWQRNRNTFY